MAITNPFKFLAIFLLSVIFFTQTAVAEKTIKVGIISGLNGPFAAVGIGAARSIELACERWNNSDAVKNKKMPQVECILEDDSFDPKRGAAAYLKLKQINKIDALINVNSATISAIADPVRKDKIPTIQVFLEGAAPTKDNIFQICPDIDEPEEILGRKVAETYSGEIALVTSINDAISRLVDSFEKGLGRKTLKFEFPMDATDVRSSVLKLVKAKPSAIMFITAPTQGVLVEKELRALDSKIPRVFDANFISAVSEFKTALGDLTPLYDSLLLNIQIPNSEEREIFQNDFRKKFKEDPAPWSELSIDGFNVLMQAYNSDPALWIENLQKTNIQGLSGKVEFSDVGVTKPTYEITTVGAVLAPKGGK